MDPDEDKYESGTEVTLTAIPEEDWNFVNWARDHESEEEEITVIMMDGEKEITANFEEGKRCRRKSKVRDRGRGRGRGVIIVIRANRDGPPLLR